MRWWRGTMRCGGGSPSPTSTPSAPSLSTSTPRSCATPPSASTSATALSVRRPTPLINPCSVDLPFLCQLLCEGEARFYLLHQLGHSWGSQAGAKPMSGCHGMTGWELCSFNPEAAPCTRGSIRQRLTDSCAGLVGQEQLHTSNGVLILNPGAANEAAACLGVLAR